MTDCGQKIQDVKKRVFLSGLFKQGFFKNYFMEIMNHS